MKTIIGKKQKMFQLLRSIMISMQNRLGKQIMFPNPVLGMNFIFWNSQLAKIFVDNRTKNLPIVVECFVGTRTFEVGGVLLICHRDLLSVLNLLVSEKKSKVPHLVLKDTWLIIERISAEYGDNEEFDSQIATCVDVLLEGGFLGECIIR